ncbi:DNA (cytosine-5)-methyltransferase 1 [Glycine soja]|nr:DNA (cytosine-5)-methyltransferase 1 [Glycine soja]
MARGLTPDSSESLFPTRKPGAAGRNGTRKRNDEDEEIQQARRHYTQAEVDGCMLYKLYDDAHVKAEEGEDNYICKIVEIFEAIDGALYFTAQWYYRAKDTVIKKLAYLIEPKRVFFSEVQDDNPLDCLVEKLNIARITLNVDLEAKKETIPPCDYYCDTQYLLPYSTFVNLPSENGESGSETSSTISSETNGIGKYEVNSQPKEAFLPEESKDPEMKLLDLYCGCGAMSTGLCLGGNLSGVNLVTRWAVDLNQHACECLKLNHPETEVHWKGYESALDSWEPIEGLSNCKEKIKEFVSRGFKSQILPLPGDVDVICGGPPCQGISGFNRFRNKESPLDDEKNKQLVVFMDIVQYLKPKFTLMENVVDLVKFAEGFLGRYALGRLLQMNYQARLGIMAAGAYGLPQFRLRVFLWGAAPSQKLPQFPLPTHDVIVRGVIPLEFEINTVAYNEGQKVQLQKKLLLEDAISDLPRVQNNERRDEIKYDKAAQTEFQRFIRLSKHEMLELQSRTKSSKSLLYDHRPLELNADDYQRVCRIPKKKGGCFRDLPGVRVGADNKVEWDPDVERVYLDSGKPLVPDYAMTFVNGTSSKPFARLWWDETVPTVVTRAEPHNQAILHPEQDRVLTIRENARLQGFPDFYKLCGPVKERYIQVGNAVAVPVARALGYTLGLAFEGSTSTSDDPLYKLPDKFPMIRDRVSSVSSEDDV